MYQLNVYAKPTDPIPIGSFTSDVHRITFQDPRYWPEFFTTRKQLELREEYWKSRGVKTKRGEKTTEVLG